MTRPLEAANAAAARGDLAACLSALLAAWRECRDPALAALIEHVGARVPAAPVPSEGIGNALRERIARATDADITTIVAVVLREVRTTPGLYALLVQLANRHPPDPRVAAGLAALVETAPFKRTDGALYGDIITALDAIDDPRFRQLILAGWARVAPRMSRLRKDRKDAEVLQRVAAAVATREPPRCAPELAASIARLAAQLAQQTQTQKKQATDTGALLQAIYDDPFDTSLRLVYADALLEVGDPRGELITLQCNRGDGPVTKRERELLRLYARTWLDAIEPIVLKNGLVYRRGFVAKAREAAKQTAQTGLLAAPAWATVEELDLTVAWGSRAQRFLADRRWKALRSVWNLRDEDVVALAQDRDDYPWTMLAVREVRDWREFARLAAFPALTELAIDSARPEAIAALAGAPLARSLRRVRLQIPATRDGVASVLAAARDANLAELDFSSAWTFAGDGDGELLRLAGDHAIVMFQDSTPGLDALTRLAELLPYGAIRTLEVAGHAKIRPGAWRPFAAALRAKGADASELP